VLIKIKQIEQSWAWWYAKQKPNYKDLKILAGQNKIIESDGKYLIKAESKEYYEGKIDMTGRKQLLCLSEKMFYSTNNLNHALDKDIVKVYVYNRRKEKTWRWSYWSNRKK
jgi:hypothetical protein